MTIEHVRGTATQSLKDPNGAANSTYDPQPIQEPLLADAEEEEFAELWAHDPGNQGS